MTTRLFHQICDYIRDLTADSPWAGHIYAVGGCCRDEIMGQPINDVDLAVDLPDGGVRLATWLFQQGCLVDEPRVYPVFGTAMLRLKQFPDDEVEIVQTRREKYLPGSKGNPITSFGSLREDCLRRDLTVNSLYRDIITGEFIDFTGRGISDIHNKILRTPDNPDVIFDDDPVRILRCIRFSARFHWPIENGTFNSLRKNVGKVTRVTRSRLRAELNKMLMSEKPSDAFKLLKLSGALSRIIPELSPTFRLKLATGCSKTAWRQTLECLDASAPNLELRWAVLLCNIGKYRVRSIKRDGTVVFNNYEKASARAARGILNRMKYDRQFIASVKNIILEKGSCIGSH